MSDEFVRRTGDPAAIAMDVAIGFARMVEALARTRALDPGADFLDHTLVNLQNHAQQLDHQDAKAAFVAARGALRHTSVYPSATKL